MKQVVAIASICLLTACGGGSDSPSVPNQPSNTPPVITSADTVLVPEGQLGVLAITATDANGDAIIFSMSGGEDIALFAIDATGVLSFNNAPDYELPIDANTNNEYLIIVQAADASSSTTVNLTIVVTDALEGRVVDGPIAGAAVFLDLDGDRVQDADEPAGVTDSKGFFKIDRVTPIAGIVPKIISVGGTDTATGVALPDIALVADVPADITKSVNLTPLSTVLASAISAAEKANVLASLGISGSADDVLTTDNWLAAASGVEAAKSVQRINQQIGLILQTATTLADDGDDTSSESIAISTSLASQIVAITQTKSTNLAVFFKVVVTVFSYSKLPLLLH